jgi:hypothetical protein
MSNKDTAGNHLSKDELLEILNQIDSEQQQTYSETADHSKEDPAYQGHPDPSNHFL